MRYQPLDPQFYIENRKKVVGEIEVNSLVILTSNSEFPRCGDTTMPFRQNSEMLYLSGIDQEETYPQHFQRLTAAGTVQDFHLLPSRNRRGFSP